MQIISFHTKKKIPQMEKVPLPYSSSTVYEQRYCSLPYHPILSWEEGDYIQHSLLIYLRTVVVVSNHSRRD